MDATVVIPAAALLTAATAIYHAGVLRGRFDKHEALIEKRVDALEQMNAKKITREELDARFDSVERQIADIGEMLRRAIPTLQR